MKREDVVLLPIALLAWWLLDRETHAAGKRRQVQDPVADGLLATFNARRKFEVDVDNAFRKAISK